MEQEYISIDLRDILFLLKKNLMQIILLTLFGALVALVISKFLMSPQYRATAMLVVNARDDANAVVTYDQITSAKQLVATYAVILTNDALLDEIIQNLNLNYSTGQLKSRITAEPVNQTQIMRLTMTDEDPARALLILEELVDSAPDILINTVKAGSVEIVSPPKVDFSPVSPRIKLNTAIGGFIGALFAVAIVFIRKALNHVFLSDEDIDEYLGVPVLGVIPSIKI